MPKPLTKDQEYWIYRECITRYGVETQLLVLAEECAELIHAITRYLQKRETSLRNVYEEVADVLNLIDQIKTVAPFQVIDQIKMKKLARLLVRLENG